jgi:hypothetical protein
MFSPLARFTETGTTKSREDADIVSCESLGALAAATTYWWRFPGKGWGVGPSCGERRYHQGWPYRQVVTMMAPSP